MMHKFYESNARSRGFTLIELMIAVGITGVLAATSIPSYKVYLDKTRLLAGEVELTQALKDFSVQKDYSPPTGMLADLVAEGFIKSIPNDPWTPKSAVNTRAEEAADWYYSNDGNTLTLYSYTHPDRKYILPSFGKAPLAQPVVAMTTTQAAAQQVSSSSGTTDATSNTIAEDAGVVTEGTAIVADIAKQADTKSDNAKSDSNKSDNGKPDHKKSDAKRDKSSEHDKEKSKD